VKLTHPDRLEEFNKKYYPQMEAEFRASFQGEDN